MSKEIVGRGSVGKTLGYVAPVGLLAEGRLAIATFSRKLQEQILRTMQRIQPVLRDHGFRERSVVMRLGMGNFLSIRKLKEIARQMTQQGATAALRPIVDSVLAWACEASEPTLLACREEIGIDAATVDYLSRYACLTIEEVQAVRRKRKRGEAVNAEDRSGVAYLEHVELARDAEVVIVNHALALIHASRWFHVLDPEEMAAEIKQPPIDTWIFDEADHLPDAERSLIEYQIGLSRIRQMLARVREAHPGANTVEEAIAATAVAWEALEDLRQRASAERLTRPSPTGERLTSERARYVTSGWQAALRRWAEALRRADRLADRWRGRAADDEEEAALYVLHQATDTVDRWLARAGVERARPDREEGGWLEGRAEVEWSPRLAMPTLLVTSTRPGSILSRFWVAQDAEGGQLIKRVVLTSATLSTAAGNVDESRAFEWSKRAWGLGYPRVCERVEIVGQRRLEPNRFGGLTFRLPKNAPEPSVITEEETATGELDAAGQGYVDWVAEVIARAYEAAAQPDRCNAGRKVLALCASWRQVEWVAEAIQRAGRIPGERCYVHRPGGLLSQLVEAWRSAAGPAVLLTPSAWEGLDCPGTISDLVIGWVPYSPPKEEVQVEAVQKETDGSKRSVRKQRGARRDGMGRVSVLASADDAIRRLKQGFGRPIRRPDDRARIWVADPRFPAKWSLEAPPKGVWVNERLLLRASLC